MATLVIIGLIILCAVINKIIIIPLLQMFTLRGCSESYRKEVKKRNVTELSDFLKNFFMHMVIWGVLIAFMKVTGAFDNTNDANIYYQERMSSHKI